MLLIYNPPQTYKGYVPSHQEEKEGAGHETWRKSKEWVREHEERERAVQVVHYCDLNGNFQTWTGAAGEFPQPGCAHCSLPPTPPQLQPVLHQ